MDSIAYGPETALIVVDVQNDFADPGGGLYVSGGEAVVPVVNAEIARARRAGAPIFFTADRHPPSTPHFAKDGGIWPVHCVDGTWGAEFHPDLILDGRIVPKGVDGRDGYSGFSTRDPSTDETAPTELASLLREAGAGSLVVVGLATDYCVKATVLDGLREGFAVTVLTDAMRAVDLQPGDGDRAMEEMEAAGAVLASAS